MSAPADHHFPFEPVVRFLVLQDHGQVRRGRTCRSENFHDELDQLIAGWTVTDTAALLSERASLHDRDLGISFTVENVRRFAYRGLTSRRADAIATLLYVEPDALWPDWHEVHDARDREHAPA